VAINDTILPAIVSAGLLLDTSTYCTVRRKMYPNCAYKQDLSLMFVWFFWHETEIPVDISLPSQKNRQASALKFCHFAAYRFPTPISLYTSFNTFADCPYTSSSR
jgi:hypothetical protein